MSSNNFTISTKTIYNISHIAWVVVTCFLLLRIIISIVQPTDIGIPIYFTVQDAGDIAGYENQKVSIDLADGVLKFDKTYQPSLISMIAYHSKILLRLSLLVFILNQVRLILKNAIDNNPFNSLNSQRLLRIGWAILAIGILKALTVLFAQYSFDSSQLNLNQNIDCNCSDASNTGLKAGVLLGATLFNSYFFMGLITIALSRAFRTGTTLKEEIDLTI